MLPDPRRTRHTVTGRILACLVVALLTTALAVPAPAAAAGGTTFGPFSVTPVPGPGGKARPYFSLRVGAGRTARDTVVVANGTGKAEKLRVTPSTGTTATNSGSAFTSTATGCTGVGCWVTGLPATLTVPPRTRTAVGFTVHVPAGTAPGQYLAGITVQAVTSPRRQVVGSNGNASVGVVVVQQATVGVAVTVGDLAGLTTRLRIESVHAAMLQELPRLTVNVRNTGQTFTKARGTAVCGAGRAAHTYQVVADTILPGDTAALAVNATGLKPGSRVPCVVRLDYADTSTTWSGTLVIPGTQHTTTVHAGNGSYAHVPDAGTPGWAIALLVVGGLILALLIGLVGWLVHQRRDPTSTENPG